MLSLAVPPCRQILATVMPLKHALLLHEKWALKIAAGEKEWEIRSRRTALRGRIGLAVTGKQHVIGEVDVVDCVPVRHLEIAEHFDKHQIPTTDLASVLNYKKIFAWVLRNPQKYTTPVKYNHCQGAVVWLKLSNALTTTTVEKSKKPRGRKPNAPPSSSKPRRRRCRPKH